MSTNKAYAKYQEIYDVNTVSDKVSVIGIHTPVGAKPRQMLSGFFTQFRKYMYRGCSVVATPPSVSVLISPSCPPRRVLQQSILKMCSTPPLFRVVMVII